MIPNPQATFTFTYTEEILNLLSANPTKWSDTLKQFVGKNFILFCIVARIYDPSES